MSYWDPDAVAWQQMGNLLWDVLALLCWTLVAGLVAFGGCWYMGQFVYMAWLREHPPPRLRFFAERRLRRDMVRGLADLEKYLRERDPARVDVGRRPLSGQSRAWRRRARRRSDRTRT